MGPEERRNYILDLLASAAEPVTGQELSERLGVSRQVIVQDIAVLRAHGKEVIATPRGYMLSGRSSKSSPQAVIACRHGRDNVREELMTIVRNGGEVVDVIVEHPVYGQLTGLLMLKSENDVEQFMQKIGATGATLLSSLTKGVHLHTVRARDSRSLGKIVAELGAKGFLVSEDS